MKRGVATSLLVAALAAQSHAADYKSAVLLQPSRAIGEMQLASEYTMIKAATSPLPWTYLVGDEVVQQSYVPAYAGKPQRFGAVVLERELSALRFIGKYCKNTVFRIRVEKIGPFRSNAVG